MIQPVDLLTQVVLQVRREAELYLELLSVQAELRALTYRPLLHVLAGAGVVPLINTHQMLTGKANTFSFLTFSTLPLVFGSLSALGDSLEVRESCLSHTHAPQSTREGIFS